ncbi:hypothetical protein [Calidifontibacillus erzurumensis]|uniref:hypothetical protein n=1 Tax=Calidifontibacillus erzurumensis TaxID=2741433 RepID=UPI0035B56683
MYQYYQMPYGMPQQQHQHDWKDFCRRYMHHLVQMQTTDGQMLEGIIDGSDDENVYMLVPDGDGMDRGVYYDETVEEEENQDLDLSYRYGGGWQGWYGGNPWYGGYPWFGYYPRRFRRFRRRRFPFFSIGGFYFPFFF